MSNYKEIYNWTLYMYQEFITFFQTNFSASLVKESISILGGLSGFFSVYYQFLRKFSPKITISNTAYFSLRGEEKFRLKHNEYVFPSIFLKIGINNTRNSFGSVEDIILRVYDGHSTEPHPTNYYLKQYGTDWNNLTDLTSISIPPKTFSEKNLMFSTDSYTNNILSLDQLRGIKVEIHAKISAEKNWKNIGELLLYPEFNEAIHCNNDSRGDFILLTALNKEELRKKATKNFKKIKSSMYKGWWDYWFTGQKNKFIYRLKKPLIFTRQLASYIWITIQRCIHYLLARFIKRKVTLNHTNTRLKMNFRETPNNKETDRAFAFIKEELLEFCNLSSRTSDSDLHLMGHQSHSEKEISISGKRGTVKLYVTGADTIYLISQEQRSKRINFRITNRKIFLEKRSFFLNDEPMFLETLTQEIIDSISLHLR